MRGPHPRSHKTFQYSDHVTDKKLCISTFTRPMDRKLSRGCLRMNPTWHFNIEVTWQIKNVIFPLSFSVWTPNLARGGGGDLGWGKSTHKVTCHFNCVVTWQVKNVFPSLSQHTRSTNLAEWWLEWKDDTQHVMCHLDHAVAWQLSSR